MASRWILIGTVAACCTFFLASFLHAEPIPVPDAPDLEQVPLVPTEPEERAGLPPSPEQVDAFFEPLLYIQGYADEEPSFLTTWTFPPLGIRELYLTGLQEPVLPVDQVEVGFSQIWNLGGDGHSFSP